MVARTGYSLTAILVTVILCSCSSVAKRSIALEPGMGKDRVLQVMGVPAARSFRKDDEAWQYQQVAGFGQCAYITVWFTRSAVVGVTNRRGPSVAGCGLGSREVDWGHLPNLLSAHLRRQYATIASASF